MSTATTTPVAGDPFVTAPQDADDCGDEFAVLLAADDPAEALAVVDAVRAALPAGRSLSAGVAPWSPGEDLGDAVQRADQALYEVKRSGRGATRLHDDVLGAAAVLGGAAR